MFRRLTKRRLLAAVTVVATLAVAGAAFAYFTSTGSGTGSATVGSSSNWTVAAQTATGGPLYPGAGSMSIPYTIKNPSSGSQGLQSVSAAVASSGGNVTQNGSAVAGCSASWFTATNNPPGLGDVPGGQTVTGSVTVTMQDDTTSSQDACQGVQPDISISAN